MSYRIASLLFKLHGLITLHNYTRAI